MMRHKRELAVVEAQAALSAAAVVCGAQLAAADSASASA
jgi:hypothetical protein